MSSHSGNSRANRKRKIEEINGGGNDDRTGLQLEASPIKPPALASLAYSIEQLEVRPYKYTVLQLLSDDKDKSNRLMSELRMSFFVAAAKDLNRENCLHPFPHCFFNRETKLKDYTAISAEIDKIPNLQSINETTELPELSWELLHWVFTNPLTLEPLVNNTRDKIEELKISTGLNNLPIPNNSCTFMFNITHMKSKPKFLEAKEKYGSKFAFHGSSVRNFHSIIHRGLISALNTRSAYGHGTYMSPNINISKQYAIAGAQGWNNSLFGHRIQCVAVVEVVMSPDTKTYNDSIYVCDNDDHMQLAHLYVFRY